MALADERLQKVLARAGIASRRRAEEIIRAGRVKVDGRLVDRLGLKVDPAQTRIEVDGKPVAAGEEKLYLAFYKPVGVVTTLYDPQGRPKLSDFLHGLDGRVFPAGRLDFDSEGLLLLTNDGELAYRLTHPRYKVAKVYAVWVSGSVSSEAVVKLASGVVLEDGPVQPAAVKVLRKEPERTLLEITLKEGKKRQVKRMCAAVGYPVVHLKREAIGPLRLGGMKPGEYRRLSHREIVRLKQQVGL
jgi:pseudouridine synthase